MLRASLLSAALALACTDAAAPTPPLDAGPPTDVHTVNIVDAPSSLDAGPAVLRVLVIGNSYVFYNDLPQLLRGLSAAEGPPRLEVEALTEGGATLERHWAAMRGERLSAGGVDALVLQGQSVEPLVGYANFHAYARRFTEAAQAAGARTVYFGTWARREGDAVYAQAWSGGDAAAMSARLDEAYLRSAMTTGAGVARVGARWQSALTARPGLGLYDPDGSHPSLAGSYLAACVLYRALVGRPAQRAEAPAGLDPAVAETLRAVARE